MPDYNAYTVGWICAVQTELVAALGLLDDRYTEPVETPVNDNNSYTLGRIGKHNVVIAALPRGQYGLTSATNIGRDMVRTFPNVRIGLMVGIGGGVPTKHDVRLGDIVVGCPAHRSGGVVQYDHGTAMQGQNISVKGALNQPPISILTAINTLSAEHELNGHSLEETIQEVLKNKPRLVKRFQRPHPDTDRLYKVDFVHDSPSMSCATACGGSNTIPRDARSMDEDNPKIHYGLIASGNQLMKDAVFRDRLSAEEDVLCFEMEAAGLSNHFPCVVIRGICDYSDSHKNDEWQGYAAMVAAAYAKELLLQISPTRVEAEGKIAEVKGLLTDVSEIKKEVKGLNHRSEREVTLDWLTRVDYASQQKDFIQQCQPGTGQWFLKSEKFQTWLKVRKGALFCPGLPGAGKTITTAIIINHLHSNFKNDSSTGIAFIYFNFQRRDKQGAKDVLASLLRQLAQNLPSLPDAVKSLCQKYGQGAPSIQEISQTLQAVVRLYSTTFIIIDAWDECQTDKCKKTLLLEICTLRSQTAANILITSRPSEKLEDQLEGCSIQEIYAHDDDVMSYIDDREAEMTLLSEKNMDLEVNEKNKLKALIRKKVGKAVDGIFLLARFHLDSLQDKTTPNQIKAGLKELPRGPQAYDESYGKTIMRIRNQEQGLRNLAKEVLTWLTFARRQLRPLELRHALGVQAGSSVLNKGDLKCTNQMIDVCMGLVKIDEDSKTISLLHHTTLEYLQNNPGCLSSLEGPIPSACLTPSKEKTIYEADENETAETHGQREITTICTTYLSFSVFRSGCCKTYGELKERLESNPFYDYATQNWGYHALEAGSCCRQVREFLNSEANVAAAIQAMMTFKPFFTYQASHIIDPIRMKALHLAADFGLHEEVASLLEDDIQPDEVDIRGQTPLSLASRKGHEAVVKELLATDGVDPNFKDKMDRSPLSHAAEKGHEAVVKELLATGKVDPDLRDVWSRTPLSHAAENGHLSVIIRLLATGQVDPESEDRGPGTYGWEGRTALSYAAEKGHKEVVRLLLKTAGVDPDSQGSRKWNYGRTPLSYAANDGHEAIVRLLLATNRVDPDSLGGMFYQTPLSYAAEAGHCSVVSFLLSTKRVDPDSKTDVEDEDDEDGYYAGRTPLSLAAGRGHEAVLNLLLATEAVEPDAKDDNGRTPLSYATESGHDSIVKLLLFTKGVDPDSKDDNGRTPLSYAAESGHGSIVKLLLSTKGVDPDSKVTCEDCAGMTPLAYAAGDGYDSIVRLLLSTKGVDPDSKITSALFTGWTPFVSAVFDHHHEVAKLLLAEGTINPDPKVSNYNHSGWTPLLFATENGDEVMVKLLLETKRVNPDSKIDDDDKNHAGSTPLSLAAKLGHGSVFRMLLEEEVVNPDSRDRKGRTPLSHAAEHGFEAAVKLLLARKEQVDPKSTGNNGHTALFYAVKNGHKGVASLLLEGN